MSQYSFGVGNGKVSEAEYKRVQAIAEKHGAWFDNPTLPGEGPRYWFSCRNMGHPFDQAIERAVLAEVGSVKVYRRR